MKNTVEIKNMDSSQILSQYIIFNLFVDILTFHIYNMIYQLNMNMIISSTYRNVENTKANHMC